MATSVDKSSLELTRESHVVSRGFPFIKGVGRGAGPFVYTVAFVYLS